MIGLSLPNRVARLISAIGLPLLCRRQSRQTRPRELRYQSQIVGVRLRPPGAQPRRPPELTLTTEPNARHLVARQDELDFPVELEADVVTHPVPEPLQALLPRQEVAEAVEIHRPYHRPQPALDVTDTLAEHGALAEQPAQPRLSTQDGPLVSRQCEPARHELVNPCREPEEALQDGSQPLGILRAPSQMPHEEPFGVVGDGVAIACAGQAEPRQRPDVHAESVLVGAVQVHRRANLGPRAIEEDPEPVVKEVEKARERGVTVVQESFARVLREMERQRAVRPEETEEPLLEPGRPLPVRLERRERRRRERDRGLLRQADRLIAGPQGLAQSRPVREQILDAAQRLEEVELPGRPRQRREQRYTICRAAIRGGHRLISPRLSDTRTSSVNVFMDASRAKTCSSTAPSR